MTSVGPFAEPIPNELIRQVSAVVPHLELRDIRLVALSAAYNAAPTEPPANVKLDHVVEHKAIVGDLVPFHVSFTLKAYGPDESQPAFFDLMAVFQLTYQGVGIETLPQADLNAFANVNAVHNAWPYLRELIQDITGRMGMVKMTLPLLKVHRPTATS